MKIAIIIPIIPKHFHFTKYLHRTNGVHFYFVFSNKEDSFKFNQEIGTYPNVYHVIVPQITKDVNIVTYKKFYAMKTLLNSSYEYFIACDSEIDIISENFTEENILYKIEEFFNKKILYASVGRYQQFSLEAATAFNSTRDFNRIKFMTEHFNLYLWWQNVPVFRRQDLRDFFSKIREDKRMFDHLAYCFYLILYRNFKIKKYNLFVEFLNSRQDFEILKKDNYIFCWAFHLFYKNEKKICSDEKIFMTYHLDRPIINL